MERTAQLIINKKKKPIYTPRRKIPNADDHQNWQWISVCIQQTMARLTQISFEDNQSARAGIGVLVWSRSNGEVYGK